MPRALTVEQLKERDAENQRKAKAAIARADASMAALAARLDKEQTRRKILVGAVVSAACEADDGLKRQVDHLLRAKLTRKDDRALFGLDSPVEPASPVPFQCAKDDLELRRVLTEHDGKWVKGEKVWKVQAGAKAEAVAAFLATRNPKEDDGGGAQVPQSNDEAASGDSTDSDQHAATQAGVPPPTKSEQSTADGTEPTPPSTEGGQAE